MDKKASTKNLEGRFWISPMFLIILTVFIDAIGFGMIFPLLAFYAKTFQVGAVEIGILVASFPLMSFIFSPILGRVSDRVGRKPILLISILTSIASFALFAVANSYWILLLSRMVAGIATERAVASAYIADVTTKKKRASGMGKLGAAMGAGFIIGPAFAGLLSVYGYSVIGFAAVLITFVNLLFVLFFLPESLNKDTRNSYLSLKSSSSYFQQVKATFSRPLIRNLLMISFLFVLAYSAMPVLLPLIGQSLFEFGSVEISYIFMYIGLVQILLQGLTIDLLAEKFSEKRLITIVLLVKAFGMFLIPYSPSIAFFLLFITISYVGTSLTRTFSASLFSKNTSQKEQGSIMGMVQSINSLARIFGPIIAGFFFEYAGITTPFLISSILLVFASTIGYRTFHRITNPRKGN